MLTFEEFKKKLQEEEYFLKEELALKVYLAINAKPARGAFLSGPAGAGKTELTEKIAKILKARFFFFQVFHGIKEEEFLIRHTVDRQGNVIAVDGILIETARFLSENPDSIAVMTIDEVDKAPVRVDALFLDFLQNGRVRYLGNTYKIDLSRLIVFFTTNNFRPLSEPLMRRLPLIEIEKPPAQIVLKILREKYGFNNPEDLKLAGLIYEASLKTELSKPVTVQELAQFLQAKEIAEDKADILILLETFITKNPEDTQELIEAIENINIQQNLINSKQISKHLASVIESKLSEKQPSEKTEEQFIPFFPEIKTNKNFTKEVKRVKTTKLPYGFIKLKDSNIYEEILKKAILLERKINSNKGIIDFFKLTHESLQQIKPTDHSTAFKYINSIANKTEFCIYTRDTIKTEEDINFKNLITLINEKNNSDLTLILKFLSEKAMRFEIWTKIQPQKMMNIYTEKHKRNLKIESLIYGYEKSSFYYGKLQEILNLFYEKSTKNIKNVLQFLELLKQEIPGKQNYNSLTITTEKKDRSIHFILENRELLKEIEKLINTGIKLVDYLPFPITKVRVSVNFINNFEFEREMYIPIKLPYTGYDSAEFNYKTIKEKTQKMLDNYPHSLRIDYNLDKTLDTHPENIKWYAINIKIKDSKPSQGELHKKEVIEKISRDTLKSIEKNLIPYMNYSHRFWSEYIQKLTEALS